jgi:ABC-type transport system involved in cytochrome c biogenesis permease subunit
VSIFVLALYVAAAAAYAAHFARRDATLGRAATAGLSAAALAHAWLIGMLRMEAGYLPVTSTAGAVSMFVWLLALAYLATEFITEERAMGAFVTPLMVLLQLVPTLDLPVAGTRPAVLESPLFGVHVVSLLFAYASFALACVIGVTYVLLFDEIKAKHLGYFYARLPSLAVLDRMNMTAVAIGWVCLTVGVVVGALWALSADVRASTDPRLQAMTLRDPKIFVALVCWGLYAFHLFARRAIGWGPRRSAWLSTAGFGLVLLNFVPIGYLFTKSHTF